MWSRLSSAARCAETQANVGAVICGLSSSILCVADYRRLTDPTSSDRADLWFKPLAHSALAYVLTPLFPPLLPVMVVATVGAYMTLPPKPDPQSHGSDPAP